MPTVFGLLLAFYLLGRRGLARTLAANLRSIRRQSRTTRGFTRVIRRDVHRRRVGGELFRDSDLGAPLATHRVAIPHLARTHPAWELSFVPVAIAAAMMGAVLPLVAHFGIEADDRAGLKLGYVYLANIIGSTLGSLLTGSFVLMGNGVDAHHPELRVWRLPDFR